MIYKQKYIKKKHVSEIEKKLEQTKQKLNKGKCFLCSKECKKYEDSHSIPISYLRKMTVRQKVYDTQSYIMIHKLIVNQFYKISWEKLFQGKTGRTGVFYNLCNNCEISEDYETKLGKNINSHLTSFDYTRIYIKSICAAKYRADFYKTFFELTKSSNTLQAFKNDYDFRTQKMLEEVKNLTGKNLYNQYNQKYTAVYDSVFYRKNTKLRLKISAMCFIPYKKDPNLCIFILSNRFESRLIVISKNDKENRQYKANLYSYNSLEKMLKIILFELVSQKFWGVVLDGTVEIEKVYTKYLNMQKKISLIKKVNLKKKTEDYKFVEMLSELDELLDEISY